MNSVVKSVVNSSVRDGEGSTSDTREALAPRTHPTLSLRVDAVRVDVVR